MGETPRNEPLRDSGESKELLRTSGAARQIERRLFLKQGLSVGAHVYAQALLCEM